YAYGSDAGGDGSSRFITQITDKAGHTSTLDWTFAANGSYWEAYKLVLTNPGSLETSFERSVSTSVCTITTSDGVSDLSKVVNTPATGDVARSRYKDYYLDA